MNKLQINQSVINEEIKSLQQELDIYIKKHPIIKDQTTNGVNSYDYAVFENRHYFISNLKMKELRETNDLYSKALILLAIKAVYDSIIDLFESNTIQPFEQIDNCYADYKEIFIPTVSNEINKQIRRLNIEIVNDLESNEQAPDVKLKHTYNRDQIDKIFDYLVKEGYLSNKYKDDFLFITGLNDDHDNFEKIVFNANAGITALILDLVLCSKGNNWETLKNYFCWTKRGKTAEEIKPFNISTALNSAKERINEHPDNVVFYKIKNDLTKLTE